jgi:hypothetical protein
VAPKAARKRLLKWLAELNPQPSAVTGLLLIPTGSLVMFARPERLSFRRRGTA